MSELLPEIFLSYNHVDRHLASRIGRELERNGYSGFMAHQNIDVSSEWRKEIRKHLEDISSALIAVVTPNFKESAWVNQEVGFAIGKGKPVVSLVFGGKIPAFLEALQGIPTRADTIQTSVKKALEFIAEEDFFRGSSTYEVLAKILTGIMVWWKKSRLFFRHDELDTNRIRETQVKCSFYAYTLLEVSYGALGRIDWSVFNRAKAVYDLLKFYSLSPTRSVTDCKKMQDFGQLADKGASSLLKYLKDSKMKQA